MDKLKVCFVGIGSIARRHIKNLNYVCNKRGIELQIDAFRHCNCGNDEISGVNDVYYTLTETPEDYDAIFITNPTELHFMTMKQFHNKGKNFFIEKPVVNIQHIQEAFRFKLRSDSIYYVACPLRYNAVIQYIKKNIKQKSMISVRSISSSYLPDWRPGQDYRKTYSAHKSMGGGVSIDLIHEWDYMTYLLGWPQRIYSMIGKRSGLEIDSDDYAIYIAEFLNSIAELHLDYFGRKTIREIQIMTKDDTIIGDLENNSLRFLIADKIVNFQEKRDDYQRREIEHFIDMLSGTMLSANEFYHSLRVLHLTQGIVGSGGLKI